MTEQEQNSAYIAVEPCGCVTGAVVDNPDHADDVARTIGRWVKQRRKVERTTVAEASRRFCLDRCDDPNCPKPKIESS